jgi:hypothetical protein
MPKVFKYGRWEPKNMERALEAVRNDDVGLNAASRAYPLRKLPEEALLHGRNYFAVENIQVTAEGELVIIFYGWSNTCIYNHR